MQRKKYPEILNEAWKDHLRPKDKNAPTVISTFAGCGGSSLGYSMAGYKELLAVEWDDNAVETFKLNFPDVPVYHGDIAKLSVTECMRLAKIKEGELDVLDGSPPCQGFSTAGKRNFSDDRNQLFREYIRLLRGLKPKVFVMENVSGMVKGVMKIIFAEIMRELKASGYDVSARLMNAMYFNVPQSRERMIFIGIRKDLDKRPSHPNGFNSLISAQNALESDDAIKTRSMKINQWMEGPAATLTKTCSDYQIKINDEIRKPEINEIRYLASFPSQFKFIGSFSIQWARIGNSVPPLFMKAIAEHIRKNILMS